MNQVITLHRAKGRRLKAKATTLCILFATALLSGCAVDLIPAHKDAQVAAAKAGTVAYPQPVRIAVLTNTKSNSYYRTDPDGSTEGLSVSGSDQSKPINSVATGAIGLATVGAYEATTLGAQGVEKATTLSRHKAGTTKHLSDNATKVGLAEIAAGEK